MFSQKNCVRAEARAVSKIKSLLKDKIDHNFAFDHSGSFVFIPLKDDADVSSYDLDVVSHECKKLNHVRDFKTALLSLFSDDEVSSLISSFEIVGDIAIIQVPDELDSRKFEIAELIMKYNRNIKTVLKKSGGREGEYRIMPLEFLRGEEKYETLHKENGCLLKLDIRKAYFSSRLSHEREVVVSDVSKINPNSVLVLFSGVAPYVVELAKNIKNSFVYGVELNPDAHHYALQNIRLNRLNNAYVVNNDARIFAKDPFNNIIGLKCSIDSYQLDNILKNDPKLVEIHTFFEDFEDSGKEHSFSRLLKIVNMLSETKTVIVHQPLSYLDHRVSDTFESIKRTVEFSSRHKFPVVLHIYTNEEADYFVKLSKKYNTSLCYIEFLFGDNVTNDISFFLELKKKARFGVTLDVAHMWLQFKDNDVLVRNIEEFSKNFSVYFHLSDANSREGLELGEGVIDFERIMPYVTFGISEVICDLKTAKEMIDTWKRFSSFRKYFDVIVMPLPKSSQLFIDSALKLSRKGTEIFMYDFVNEADFEKEARNIELLAEKNNRHVKVVSFRRAGQFSPRVYRLCFRLLVLD